MTDRDLLQQMIARIGKEPRAAKFDDDDNLVELNLAGLDLEELPAEVLAFSHLRGLGWEMASWMRRASST